MVLEKKKISHEHQTATSVFAENVFLEMASLRHPDTWRELNRLTPFYAFTTWDDRFTNHPDFWRNLWRTDRALTAQIKVGRQT